MYAVVLVACWSINVGFYKPALPNTKICSFRGSLRFWFSTNETPLTSLGLFKKMVPGKAFI